MDTRETLIEAIDEKKLVNFNYENHPIRKAAPHAIYWSKQNKENLDAFQYEGFSKTGNLPNWRNFTLSKIQNLEILGENFEVADGYKSYSEKYSRSVHKI